MAQYFIEQRRLDSWHPAIISGEAPATVAKNGKIYLRRSEGLGARIRETPRQIRTEDEGKPLSDMATIYGADNSHAAQPENEFGIFTAMDARGDDWHYKPSYGDRPKRRFSLKAWLFLVFALVFFGLVLISAWRAL